MPSTPPPPLTNFSQLQAAYYLMLEQKQYEKAVALIRRIYNQFPHAHSLLIRWSIGLFALMGQEATALRALEDAVTNGHYYREAKLRHDADLQPLRQNPRFRSLSSHSGVLYEEKRRQTQPEMLLLPPSAPPPWPLLLVLHENMGSAPLAQPYWHTAVAQGWLVALLQSQQLSPVTNHYVWDDIQASIEQVTAQYETLRTSQPINPEQVVLAGYGQGGLLAHKLVANHPFPSRGGILIEGWSLDEFKSDKLFLGRVSRPRYYLMAGHLAPGQIFDFYEEAQKLARQLGRMGFLGRVEALKHPIPGLPSDLSTPLAHALTFILGNEAASP
jgi:hypothetical protein